MLTLRSTLCLLLAVALLSACTKNDPGENNSEAEINGLPWQITVFDDGSSEVFGLRLGHSSLNDARNKLSDEMDLAIIIDQQNQVGMEMYIKHFKAGVLAGKLVLVADLSQQQLGQMINNLDRGNYMASGARKLSPTDEDQALALNSAVASITFIPSINLDEDIILNRFGDKPQKITINGDTHFLYPERGLDVVMNERGKELLQYVAPAEFEQLRQPLIMALEQTPTAE